MIPTTTEANTQNLFKKSASSSHGLGLRVNNASKTGILQLIPSWVLFFVSCIQELIDLTFRSDPVLEPFRPTDGILLEMTKMTIKRRQEIITHLNCISAISCYIHLQFLAIWPWLDKNKLSAAPVATSARQCSDGFGGRWSWAKLKHGG